MIIMLKLKFSIFGRILRAAACIIFLCHHTAYSEEIDKKSYQWCISEKIDELLVSNFYKNAEYYVKHNENNFINGDGKYFLLSTLSGPKILFISTIHSYLDLLNWPTQVLSDFFHQSSSVLLEMNPFLPIYSDIDTTYQSKIRMNNKPAFLSSYFEYGDRDDVKKLKDFLAARHVNIESSGSASLNSILDLLSNTASACDVPAIHHFESALGMDALLGIRAVIAGKEILGAESPRELSTRLGSYTPQVDYPALIHAWLNLLPNAKSWQAARLVAISNGRMDIAIALEMIPGFGPSDFTAFSHYRESRMPTERENGLYDSVIERIHSDGTHVVAFGASHLIGQNGIVERLRSAGYQIRELDH